MNKAATLTLKIINDQDVLDTLPKGKELTEDHKALIRMIARTAVDEYIREMKHTRPQQQSRTSDRIIRLREVVSITGLSRSSIYAYISQGIFPKPTPLGIRSVGWKESQITEWLTSR